MNFIAGVLLESLQGHEERAFLIFMYLIVERDMKPLFLPVSFFFVSDLVL
jgi:hypothetical protein